MDTVPEAYPPSRHGVPEGTLRIEVHGAPQTEQELKYLRRILANLLWYDMVPSELATPPGEATMFMEQLESNFFSQPYQQGGGYVEIIRMTLEEAQESFHHNEPADLAEGPWGIYTDRVPLGAVFTGWYLIDHYTDSMTSEYSTPFWEIEGDEQLYTLEP